MTDRAPGFLKYPNYQVVIAPSSARVRARVDNAVIADTRQALKVEETRHAPVWYLPLSAVDPDVIEPSSTRTHCPFKGDASYWNLHAAGKTLPDAMWAYPTPFDECRALAGYVAFYPDRVTVEAEDDPSA